MSEEELKEKLASIEHDRWADWQKWCHKVLRENNSFPGKEDILERWDRQIETPYVNLSEKEKQSDRDQVDRYWPLIKEYIAIHDHELLDKLLAIGPKDIEILDSDDDFRKNYEGYNEANSQWRALIEQSKEVR